MSDGGGGDSSQGIESDLRRRRWGRSDEFAQSIARIAVAQVCESVGFQGFQQSALDTLSDIACKYIRDIGKASNFYTNAVGRTESNILDIIQGLEDLGLSQGFVGASDKDHCLSGSGIIKDISQYVGVSEEVGFAYSVPSFPVIKSQNSTSKPSFLQAGEIPPTADIPPWLPRFPDPKTYTCLPSTSKEETQMRPDRLEQQQKVLEPSSLNFEQLLACNGSQLPVEEGDNARRELANNPFLAMPLQPGKKEVSLVTLPAKLMEEDVAQNHSLWANHVSALETFAPVIQANKTSECDMEEGSRKALLNSRPALQLKFCMGKKSLATANRQNDKECVEAMSWFMNDESRDDKRRRTEKVLREQMDIGEHGGSDSVVN